MNQEQRIEYFMSEIARLSNHVVDLQDERDALASQVVALRREIQSAADWFSAYWPELNKAQCDRIRQMDKIAKTTPQQHLAEVKARASQAALEFCDRAFSEDEHHRFNLGDCVKEYTDSIQRGKK